VNDGLFVWDIKWLHYLILSARINKGLRGCETSALLLSIHVPTQDSHNS